MNNMKYNMKYRTCFSSVSHHGYKLDILKSGIQKYLRRRESDKMIWCAMEIFKFELWSENEKEKKMCKGIISNMLNRIIVMMDEELLFCEIERYVVLREMIEKFDKDRKNGFKYLLNICKCLSEGRISRRSSDIRGCWCYNMKNKDEGMSDKEYFKNLWNVLKEKMMNVLNGCLKYLMVIRKVM